MGAATAAASMRMVLGVSLVTAACTSLRFGNRPLGPEADPPLPIVTVAAPQPGPTVALVAGIHGGKVSAIRAVERLAAALPSELRRGTVLLVAPANVAGYRAGLAQLSPLDSLNLNRVFPGSVSGRPTERLAARIVREVVAVSDFVVDLHGSDGDEAVGRFAYAARPGVNPAVDSAALQLAVAWGVPTIVWDDAGPRTLESSRFLQTAAHLSDVPAITVFEAGTAREEPMAIDAFVTGARALLRQLGMLDATPTVPEAPARRALVLPRRDVTVALEAGTWVPEVRAGDTVAVGARLGMLHSAAPAVSREVRAATAGLVLHQRRAGWVTADTPLIIAGVFQD